MFLYDKIKQIPQTVPSSFAFWVIIIVAATGLSITGIQVWRSAIQAAPVTTPVAEIPLTDNEVKPLLDAAEENRQLQQQLSARLEGMIDMLMLQKKDADGKQLNKRDGWRLDQDQTTKKWRFIKQGAPAASQPAQLPQP